MEHPTTEPSSPEAVPKTTDVSAETEPQTATLDNQNQTQWPGFGDDGVVEIVYNSLISIHRMIVMLLSRTISNPTPTRLLAITLGQAQRLLHLQ